MVDGTANLSVRHQCQLLGLNRSSYYAPVQGESALNLELMRRIDRINLAEPSFGVLRMQDALKEQGYHVNVKRVRRLMRKMCIQTIYPKRNLSKLGHAQYVYAYLLRHLEITKPNQVWAIDITYIPMEKGFMYLTAIIDLFSRYLLAWDLSNSLAAEIQTDLVDKAIEQYTKPDIINSDQGSQYTCSNWVTQLKKMEIQISMDGKGRATDNAFIERFFRSLKWDHVYLFPANDGIELYKGISTFIDKYNNRAHQGIDRRKPVELYATV